MLRILLITLLVSTSAFAQDCETTNPEIIQALDAVHAAREGSVAEANAAIEAWLSKVSLALVGIGTIDGAWYHVGVDLSRLLERVERRDDATRILRLIAERDRDGQWGKAAAAELAKSKE